MKKIYSDNLSQLNSVELACQDGTTGVCPNCYCEGLFEPCCGWLGAWSFCSVGAIKPPRLEKPNLNGCESCKWSIQEQKTKLVTGGVSLNSSQA